MIGAIASALVRVVRAGHRRQVWLSVAGLVLTLAVASAYLLIGALRVAPFASSYDVTVQLPESGGLLPNQDVSLRGVRVGRIESLRITDRGVNAVASIRSKVRIPASAVAHVSALSPAGEQFIDLQAESDAGPYLHDGSVIGQDRTTVPVSLAQLLGDADGLLAQVDPHKVELIKKELRLSKEGPAKLAAIVDGGTFLLSTLDSVLPQTTSIIKTSRVVLTLAADENVGLAAMTTDLNKTLAGVARMQGGYRRLTERAPHTLSAVDSLFTENSDTMVQLLGSMATLSQLLYLRVPALNALFPDYRGSVLDAVASAFHDHGVWATADLYPRYTCDYGTPSRPPSSADYYEPFTYTYCRDDDPAVSIRGAKNAPRPVPMTRPARRRVRIWDAEPIQRRRAATRFPLPMVALFCRSSRRAKTHTSTRRSLWLLQKTSTLRPKRPKRMALQAKTPISKRLTPKRLTPRRSTRRPMRMMAAPMTTMSRSDGSATRPSAASGLPGRLRGNICAAAYFRCYSLPHLRFRVSSAGSNGNSTRSSNRASRPNKRPSPTPRC